MGRFGDPRGGSLNLNLHYHIVFLEGVFVDRTAQGLKPRFLPADPPMDADIATVLHKVSQRVIRELRKRGYLEADTQGLVPTGYDPASDEDPELARALAASVQQRLAFGERAGQRVRRIGSGFGDEGEIPTLTGNRCASVNGFSLHANTHVPAHRRDELERLLRYTLGIKLSPLELLEKLAALVPLPRMHLLRYGGCLAPHSHLRAAIIPTPRQQGLEAPDSHTASPN